MIKLVDGEKVYEKFEALDEQIKAVREEQAAIKLLTIELTESESECDNAREEDYKQIEKMRSLNVR